LRTVEKLVLERRNWIVGKVLYRNDGRKFALNKFWNVEKVL